MYPPVKQFESRSREIEELVALAARRRAARAGASPRSLSVRFRSRFSRAARAELASC